MSLSFEESLKINKGNNVAKSIAPDMPVVASEDIGIALPDVMTLDETSMMAAYSGDDGNWHQHPDYVYYSVFSDDNVSVIDDGKNINLDNKQYKITQEENSQ